jgi:threonine synthase
LGHFIEKRAARDPSQRLNVAVGTSGDTGSAAIEAVRGLPNVTNSTFLTSSLSYRYKRDSGAHSACIWLVNINR